MRLDIGNYQEQTVFLDTAGNINEHLLITGKSGSGKTVEIQRLVTQIVENNGTVLAIDFHSVFAADQILPAYAPVWNTQIEETDAYTNGISCPLLSPLTSSTGNTENILDLQLSLCGIFQTALKLGTRQASILTDAIIQVEANGSFKEFGIKALDSYLSDQEDDISQRLRQRLLPLTMRNLFRDGNLFIKKGKLNLLRLSDFDITTQHIAAEITLAIIWRYANTGHFKKNPLTLVIDEFQNLSITPSSVLIRLLTQGRKLGVNRILATQLLRDYSRRYLEQYISQAATLLIFRPSECDTAAVQKRIDGAHPQWQEELRSLGCGEFIIVGEYDIAGRHYNRPIRISAYQDPSTTGKTSCSVDSLCYEIRDERRRKVCS